MARLVRLVATQTRVNKQVDETIVEAMAAGENQSEIARVVGRSREHLRNVRRRFEQGE